MLGGTLVYAATGHPPFHSAPGRRLRSRPAAVPPDLSGLPDGLVPIVKRCLAEDPASRPALSALAAEFSKREHSVGQATYCRPRCCACSRFSARSWTRPVMPARAQAPGPSVRRSPGTGATINLTRARWMTLGRNRGPGNTRGMSCWSRTTSPVTVAEKPHRPSRRVIQPVRLDHSSSWDTRDDSWQSVRWACQFGAWIQAPVTVVGRVAVAVDLNGTIGGLDAFDGGQLWAFGLRAAVRSAAVPLPGPAAEVCLGDADGVVHAVELRSGKRRTLLRAGGAIHGPMAVDGSRIYAVSADGGSTPSMPRCRPTGCCSARAIWPHVVLPYRSALIFAVTTQGEVRH